LGVNLTKGWNNVKKLGLIRRRVIGKRLPRPRGVIGGFGNKKLVTLLEVKLRSYRVELLGEVFWWSSERKDF